MSQLIRIEIDRLEGTLLRVLGLIERRGFHIDGLELSGIDENTRLAAITVRPRDASRSLETLGLQIDRLYGIRRLVSTPADTVAKQKISA